MQSGVSPIFFAQSTWHQPANQVDILCLALSTWLASKSLDSPSLRLRNSESFLKCCPCLPRVYRAGRVAKNYARCFLGIKVSPLYRLPKPLYSQGHIRRIPIHSGCAEDSHTRTHSWNHFYRGMSTCVGVRLGLFASQFVPALFCPEHCVIFHEGSL